MKRDLSGAVGALADPRPQVWSAYAGLGEASAETGPLTERERRLVKLALAIGARSEGAVRAHARRAREEGIEDAALRQAALLCVGALGLPKAVAALAWIDDAAAPAEG